MDGSEHSKTSQVKSKITLPQSYILNEHHVGGQLCKSIILCKDCQPTKVPRTSVVQTHSQTLFLVKTRLNALLLAIQSLWAGGQSVCCYV